MEKFCCFGDFIDEKITQIVSHLYDTLWIDKCWKREKQKYLKTFKKNSEIDRINHTQQLKTDRCQEKIPKAITPDVNIPNAIIPNSILAMPQRLVGLDMKLSQPNMWLHYPLDYVKTYV